MSVLPSLRARPDPAVRRRRGRRVDVWQVGLDLPEPRLERAAALLTPAELARADRGTPTVRRRTIAMRAALRTVLGQELDCAPGDVPLATTAHGRPFLDGTVPRYDLNCTGSDDLGLIVVARGSRVGIDVEPVAPWTEETAAEGWLSPAEVAALRALPPAERAEAATRCWTQKEAVLKALGSGLSLPPAGVPTSPGRACAHSGGWVLFPVVVPSGFVATLACSARIRTPGSAVVPRLLPDLLITTGHR
jgi:4'-phosphopantetheinyl transferase